MFKNFLPNKILLLKNETINVFVILLLLILSLGLSYALFFSPPDYIQGDSVRIMYVHVPASFFALGCFAFLGVASIFNLIFRIKFISLMAKSLAPAGLLFSIISNVTGSFWGKPTWGVWWAWDARLTSMLILIIFYFAYILAWKIIDDFEPEIVYTAPENDLNLDHQAVFDSTLVACRPKSGVKKILEMNSKEVFNLEIDDPGIIKDVDIPNDFNNLNKI